MLTYSEEEVQGNYWLGNKPTEEFIIALCEPEIIKTLRLVNTHNAPHKKRATRDFKVYLSDQPSGPWTLALDSSFVDPQEESTQPVLDFPITPSLAEFIKFEMVSYHGGHGGGLQYIAALPGQHLRIFIVCRSAKLYRLAI